MRSPRPRALAASGVLATAAAGAGLRWARRRFVAVTVDGVSMHPTFVAGDRVLVRRVPAERIRRGDVVVLEAPDAQAWTRPAIGRGSPRRGTVRRIWLIKRAVALPGDAPAADLAAAIGVPPGATVPAGRLAVLGDNRGRSRDSRAYGLVPDDRVLGVAVRRL